MIRVKGKRVSNGLDYSPKEGDLVYIESRLAEYKGLYLVEKVNKITFDIRNIATMKPLRFKREGVVPSTQKLAEEIDFLGFFKSEEDYEKHHFIIKYLTVLYDAVTREDYHVSITYEQLLQILDILDIKPKERFDNYDHEELPDIS